MECRYCRNEIADGERFCPYCGGEQYIDNQGGAPEVAGTQILGAGANNQAYTNYDQSYGQDVGGTQLLTPDMEYYSYDQSQNGQSQNVTGTQYQQPEYQQAQGTQDQQAYGGSGQEEVGDKKKKKKKWLFFAIPAALIVAAAVLFLVFELKGTDSEIFYLKDNELYGADLSKSKPEGFLYGEKYYADRDDFSGYMRGRIAKSEDGKYLFFSGNYEDGSYTLYCKNLRKDKEEAVKVDSGVTGFTVIGKNKIVYRKDNDALYVHDLKNKEKIAGDISSYWIAQDGSYVMWTVAAEDSTYDLYYRDIALKNNKQKLDSYVSGQVRTTENLEHIVYVKDNNLYAVDNWGEKEKLASDVNGRLYSITTNSERMVYFLKKGEPLTAGELFKDDMKSEAGNVFVEQFNKRMEEEGEVYTLCCYNMQDGTSNELDTDVVAMEAFSSGAVGYAKLIRDEIKKINLSDAYRGSTGEMQENMEAAVEAYVACGSSTAQLDMEMSSEIVDSLYDSEGECIYFLVYPDDEEDMGELMRFDCSVKGFGDVTTVEVDVNELLTVHQGKVYYLCDYSSDSGELYCDGDNIASDVRYCYGVAGSDSVMVISDVSRDGDSYSLSLYKNGKLTGIADDVSEYVALSDNKIAMLIDYNFDRYRGDLVYYNGKKTLTIDTDVSAIY